MRAGVLAALLATALALPGAGLAASKERHAPPGDALTRALAAGRLTLAQYALQRALSVFHRDRVTARFGAVARPGPRDATLIFRDLAARTDELSRHERRRAAAILARPTDGARDPSGDGYTVGRQFRRRLCTINFCIHWVTRSIDAPSLMDRRPRNRVPDWIDRTRAVMSTVWSTEIGRLGYRRPLSDAGSGSHNGGNPNGKVDIFIAEIGAVGLYGYCAVDDPRRRRQLNVAGYCVLDDNYARSQFRRGAFGLKALKVTAAHEFHHDIQFAYDWLEDPWFMEGTATAMEEKVYDGINDNRQFLDTSAVSRNRFWRPIDYGRGGFKYGAWVFWQFLGETFGDRLVLDVWKRADGRAGAPDEYSLLAVENVLDRHGQTFAEVFSTFGLGNLKPASTYSEGAAWPAPVPFSFNIGPANPTTGQQTIPMFHTSNDYYRFVPDQTVTGDTLTIALNLPEPSRGSRAAVIPISPAGGLGSPSPVTLNSSGDATVTVDPFTPDVVGSIILVLTNTSTRFTCWRRTELSCRGIPLDDLNYVFTASLS